MRIKNLGEIVQIQLNDPPKMVHRSTNNDDILDTLRNGPTDRPKSPSGTSASRSSGTSSRSQAQRSAGKSSRPRQREEDYQPLTLDDIFGGDKK